MTVSFTSARTNFDRPDKNIPPPTRRLLPIIRAINPSMCSNQKHTRPPQIEQAFIKLDTLSEEAWKQLPALNEALISAVEILKLPMLTSTEILNPKFFSIK
eukprot:COSAG01_NODE_1_length_100484_cov_170.446142_42_plen_101_part_00